MAHQCSISGFSIYFGTQSDIRFKSYGNLNLRGDSLFNFESLDMLRSAIRRPSQDLSQFEFAQSFHVEFQVSRYMLVLNQTSMSKVIAVWICSSFHVQFRVSRYSSQKLWSFEFSWSFRLSSRVSRYIMGLNRKLESKDIQFKFASRLRVQFWASRYIMDLNHKSSQKLWAFEFARSFHVQFR